ncbi:M24 family metallopeptidase [Vibrio cholerae]|nr:M24 family metallopeptidase [Vibrio cholerae]
MRVAGRLVAEVLEIIEPRVKAGVTTEELDQICLEYITEVQCLIPAPLTYHGFPKSISTSINHIVCHGIPASEDSYSGRINVLRYCVMATSLISILRLSKTASTAIPQNVLIGDVSIEDKRLCHMAQGCLYFALKQVKAGVLLGLSLTTIENTSRPTSKQPAL